MRRKTSEALDLLDYYLGDDIEEILEEVDETSFDIDDEYDSLLKYIYRSIVKAWFKGSEPSKKELKEKIERYKSSRYYSMLRLFLSYLISRYAEIKRAELIHRGEKDDRKSTF
ncbi:MAG: hypothetical protein ACP5I2_02040 [Fervidicoccaceae archaeon]|jgi:fatty acid-binding protein DegV|uniref:Uncharacterized protein n=1 Tax=Fervidicoccus fontis TaxID=683846 RepID=A0A7C2UPQ0_9CREN|nr:MAG: hypothetical protein C0179_06140 [Fervidicoccus sp.]HEU97307.1 hypothetical protein [Fervidicoccus fontis]